MSNLTDAIADLKETLKAEGFTDTLVAEIAEDYEVNTALLARKFEECTGKTPKDFKVVDTALSDDYLIAQGKALWTQRRVVGEPGSHRLFGKKFTRGGREIMAVCLIRGNELLGIDTQDGKPFNLAWKNRASVYAGLQQFGLN